MRAIKECVRELKKRLKSERTSRHNESAAMMAKLEDELASLKGRWEKWEAELREAARERMVFLGHEEE
jgi:hypothetical protein